MARLTPKEYNSQQAEINQLENLLAKLLKGTYLTKFKPKETGQTYDPVPVGSLATALEALKQDCAIFPDSEMLFLKNTDGMEALYLRQSPETSQQHCELLQQYRKEMFTRIQARKDAQKAAQEATA